MGSSRQNYWSGFPFSSLEFLPDSGIEPGSPTLQADALPPEPPGKPVLISRPKAGCRGFPGGASGKESACKCTRHKRRKFDPWVGKIPWRRAWQPTPVFLPGESYGQRSLVGYSPQDHEESDTTEHTQSRMSPLFQNVHFLGQQVPASHVRDPSISEWSKDD